MSKILIVEDDATTAAFVIGGLREAGFVVEHSTDGRDGLFRATDGSYDAIILDRMLPGLDGMGVLAALRAAGVATPVLILSALSSLDDRVAGLRAGSDDYLAKPFAFAELHARLEALLRRPQAEAANSPVRLECGDLSMDLLGRRVTRAGQRIDLQPREYRLLEYMLRHAGHVLTRTMLLEGVWDYHFDPGTNVIDVQISRLRRKIDEGFPVALLHTVRGAGYRLGEA